VGQGSVDQIGEDLLDHRVRPVSQIRLHRGEGGVGEKGVVAEAGQQLVLPGGILPADAAHHQPGGELMAGAG
jgi:hypothetical protein